MSKLLHRQFSFAVLVVLISVAALRADEGDPASVAGRLGHLSGTVSIQPSGINQWSTAAPNYPIAAGDRVYADQDGRAALEFGDAAARLWNGTDVTVTSLADDQVQLGLSQGSLHLLTRRIDSTDLVEVDTPNGAMTVVRPGDVRITIYPGDGGTVISVLGGEVNVSGAGLNEDVHQGQSVRLIGANPISASRFGMQPPDAFDGWSQQLDRAWRNSPSAQYVNQDIPGYDDLDANGEWVPDSDYGPVWYPTTVAVGWAPYRYGRWVWSGPWGWTWVEEEPWGYAPFHYGRWVQVRDRWGWVPGPVRVRPVWSPALVAFVGGPGFSISVGGPGVAAWFPLGPGEPYYPWYHCSPRYVDRINITNIRPSRVVVVQKTYYTTNIVNVHYNYRTVGVTAVRNDAFINGRPVRQNIVTVDRAALDRAQLLPHPALAPTVHSLAPQPVNNVRVSTQRPMLMTRDGQQMRAMPGAVPQPLPRGGNSGGVRAAPQQGWNQQPQQNNSRAQQMPSQQPQPQIQQPSPRSNARFQPMPSEGQQGSSSVHTQPAQSAQQPAGLVYRNEPKAAQPSFQQQQPALNQHPGRPLEPQQVDNLRQGHAAGPQRDPEAAPHAAPAQQQSRPAASPAPQQQRPAPAPKAAPPQKPQDKDNRH